VNLSRAFFIVEHLVIMNSMQSAQDIDPVTSTKSLPHGDESPKVDKPLSLQAEKTTLEPMKPLSPEDVQGPVNVEDAPTSPTPFASSYDAALDSPRL
jgi:hypothetical protein